MKKQCWVLFILIILLIVGCIQEEDGGVQKTATSAPLSTGVSPTATQVEEETTAAPTATQVETEEEDVAVETETAVSSNNLRQITILYTNDEHGWMSGTEPGSGAAELMGLWRDEEGYQNDDNFVLLSGGDMWTGPAISTWFQGASMAEVMNAMGYRAAAIGNHEFDFGLDTLAELAAASTFPFVSANIRYKADGSIPTDIGIQPYTIITVNDIRIGITGLTTTSTPRTTNPVNVTEFDFIEYETALRDIVPQIEAEGVDLIFVPAHICEDEMRPLANQVADLGIDLLGGGHCNELFDDQVGEMILLEGGTTLGSYAYATLQFDLDAGELVEVSTGVRNNVGGTAVTDIQSIVTNWQVEADKELNRVIGYSENGIARRSTQMQNLITESWLWGYPTADVAVTNWGGMRADVLPGDITLADVVTFMPFENVIVDLSLTGEQLINLLEANSATAGGVHRANFEWILNETGAPIDADAIYSVLVNDFMYAGGDEYTFLADYDPNGYNTAINWRQPVIDWIEAQDSTSDNPIDDTIDSLDQ